MPTTRRLSTALLALLLGVPVLTVGVPAAAEAHGAPSRAVLRDAPHDPATYYAGTDGLTGTALEAKLHTIISGNTQLSYDDVFEALKTTDQDPNSSSSIIDIYSGTSLLKTAQCNHGGSCAGEWNREHTWAKSHGDFGTVIGPGTDLFHMRPELADVNSTRNNLDFDNGGTSSVTDCSLCKKDSDSFEPRDAIKGDVARGLFYMATRYDGGDGYPDLVLNDSACNAGSKAPNIGKLSTLVAWSLADPPDALEKARNDLVDGTYQHNRNPFIDHPEWVTSIWGNGVGQGPACGTTGTGTGTGTGGGGGTTDPGTGSGAPPSNVVISEAYVNGGSTGATYKNKFVELYNPLTSTVDLSPYSLQYRSATGTGTASGRYDFTAGAQIAPQSYFVVELPGNSTGAGGALPQIDANASASAVNPAAGGGTLYLAGTHASVLPTDDSVGDTIGWGTSNAPETTAATGNSVTLSYQRNATNSDTDNNKADFTATAPTPGTGPSGGVNHAPTTSPMTASTPEDTATTVPLVATDADSDTLSWAVSTSPAHGQASVTGSTLSYTPAADYDGTDTVGVTVSDGHGGTASTTVTITVTPVNDAPTAADVSSGTSGGTAKQVQLAGSDVDDAPGTLTYTIATQPAHGSVSVSGSVATYTPSTGYAGADAFTYTVSDPGGATSSPATVTISVASSQQPPTASAVSASTAEDQPVTFTLPASDPNGDAITYALASQPAHGAVSLSGAQATYTPAPDFHGADAFTFTASDATSTSSPATASITITPVNDAPTVSSKTATTPEDTATAVDLSGTDVDGDALAYAISGQPAHGSVSVSGAQATYTPAPDFNGTDSFTFTVSDGTATTTGTATVTVTPVNDRPMAGALTATTDEDGSITFPLAGSDVDGDALTYAVATPPAHGSVTLSGVTATYTPTPGQGEDDSFTYTASDGSLTSLPATVTLSVTPVDHDPQVSATQLHTTAGTPVSATLEASDPDGDPVAISAVSDTAHGTVTYSGTSLTYTPTDREGTDTFFVTVSDGRGGTASAQVGVDVTARVAQLTVLAPSVTRGAHARITITASAATGSGPVPTGRVTLLSGATTITTAVLGADGTATITDVPHRAGTVPLHASYDGDTLYGPAVSPSTTWSVRRAAATLGLSAGTLRRGRAGVVRVSVRTVDGVVATGPVRLTAGSRRLTARLAKGVATFRIAGLPSTAKLKVSASYAGDTQYLAGSATHTYAVRR